MFCLPYLLLYSQILQTNKGSLLKNLKYWAKDVWNIFDIVMYLMFLLSVVLRCLLNSEQFYFARMAYAITLSMFILRSMHFFFIQRDIGPKVVMIGRMVSIHIHKMKDHILKIYHRYKTYNFGLIPDAGNVFLRLYYPTVVNYIHCKALTLTI